MINMHQICSLNWLNFSTILGGGGWGTELWIKNTQLNLIKQVLNLGAGDQWSDVLSSDLHCTKIHKQVC